MDSFFIMRKVRNLIEIMVSGLFNALLDPYNQKYPLH